MPGYPDLSSLGDFIGTPATTITINGPFPGIGLISSATSINSLPYGTNGQVLTISAGVPSWATLASSWSFSGLTGTTQTVNLGDTVSFTGSNLITTTSAATNVLDVSIDTTGAISGQVITFNGTSAVWGTNTGQIAFTKTKAEIDTLIAGGDLVAGALYEITGVHPTLYDDGTTSGTTVYLRAISGSELEVQGIGKFYNPKYNQAVDGFGIWENKMYGTFSSISGTFDYQNKETVTANNAATGILLADGMIQFVSGDWSTATSITGDVSSATATVAGFVTPTYSIGDKVIWGGYSWTNVNGNIGASTDVLNLDSEWSKNVYDTTNYNLAYDLIEYDYSNDWISRRYEIASNVDVRITKISFDYFVDDYGFAYSSISVQQFGNPFDYNIGKGILNKYLDNAYDESINFSGSYQYILTFGTSSSQYNLTFGQNSSQENLTFGQSAYQYNLTFGQSAYQYNLTFGQNSRQNNLTFGQSSSQYNLTFGQNSRQNNLTFGQSAYQGNLTFGQNSSQNNLTFGQSAYQYNLTFGENSYQYNLTFNHNIIQRNIEFDINTQLDYSSQTLSTSIINARFRTNGGAVTIPNISTATYIYDNTLLKDIYTRPDGTLKLKYMNNSDVLVVNNITD